MLHTLGQEEAQYLAIIQEIDVELHELAASAQDLFEGLSKHAYLAQIAELAPKLKAAKAQEQALSANWEALLQAGQEIEVKLECLSQELLEAGSSYKKITQINDEIESMQVQADANTQKLQALEVQLEQLQTVITQAQKRHDQLVAAYDREKSAGYAKLEKLKTEQAELKVERREQAAHISEELMARYEKSARIHGLYAVARLDGSSCSVCRSTLDPARLLQVKKEAPVSSCPSCGRVLLVLPCD